jgi:hypothetical protein
MFSFACWEKSRKGRKKKQKETSRGIFLRPGGQTCLAGWAGVDSVAFGAIKG